MTPSAPFRRKDIRTNCIEAAS